MSPSPVLPSSLSLQLHPGFCLPEAPVVPGPTSPDTPVSAPRSHRKETEGSPSILGIFFPPVPTPTKNTGLISTELLGLAKGFLRILFSLAARCRAGELDEPLPAGPHTFLLMRPPVQGTAGPRAGGHSPATGPLGPTHRWTLLQPQSSPRAPGFISQEHDGPSSRLSTDGGQGSKGQVLRY